MLWNIIIVAITAVIIASNLFIFKSSKIRSKIKLRKCLIVTGLFFLIPWTVALLPNVLLVFSPLTPEVKGRIVDMETKKPLPDVKIKAAWYRDHEWPWTVAKARYKNFDTVSDSNGEFCIPRTVKAFTFFIPILHTAKYGGIYIFAYDHDYSWQSGLKVIPSGVKSTNVEKILMRPIKDDMEYLISVRNTYLEFSSMQRGSGNFSDDDWSYLIEAHQIFDTKYPNSKLAEQNLLELNSVFREMGNFEEAINTLEEMIRKYPSGEYAEYAKEYAINSLKKALESRKGAKK